MSPIERARLDFGITTECPKSMILGHPSRPMYRFSKCASLCTMPNSHSAVSARSSRANLLAVRGSRFSASASCTPSTASITTMNTPYLRSMPVMYTRGTSSLPHTTSRTHEPYTYFCTAASCTMPRTSSALPPRVPCTSCWRKAATLIATRAPTAGNDIPPTRCVRRRAREAKYLCIAGVTPNSTTVPPTPWPATLPRTGDVLR